MMDINFESSRGNTLVHHCLLAMFSSWEGVCAFAEAGNSIIQFESGSGQATELGHRSAIGDVDTRRHIIIMEYLTVLTH